MRTLLATCLAICSAGSALAWRDDGGLREPWKIGMHCKQLKKGATICLGKVLRTHPLYEKQLNQRQAKKELQSCVNNHVHKARATHTPCTSRIFTQCLTQALDSAPIIKDKTGVRPFVQKFKYCLQRMVRDPGDKRAMILPMTTILPGQRGTEASP